MHLGFKVGGVYFKDGGQCCVEEVSGTIGGVTGKGIPEAHPQVGEGKENHQIAHVVKIGTIQQLLHLTVC